MSEEIRFKYLEELERSEALDGTEDTSRERRRRRRSEEESDRPQQKGRNKSDGSRKSREEGSRDTVRRSKRDSGAEHTGKKRKKKSTEPERDVRRVSVSETRSRRSERSDMGHRSSGTRRSTGGSRRRSSERSRRETDWEALLEETARLEAEDSRRQERESRERRKKRTNDAERREREEKQKRERIMRIVAAVAAVILVFVVVRTVLHLVKPSGSGTAETESSETAQGIVTSPQGTTTTSQDVEQTEVSADVTVAPTSSVVSIDSADQLNTIFEDWQYTPSATDVAPEGDIVPVTDTFYSHDMMKRDLYLLRERYPDSVSILRFGYTADGRDLLDVVIGDPSAQKDVIIQYSMHAREYVNSLLAMKQIEELLKGMNNGTQYNGVAYSDILKGVRLHLIPMMNPDGVMVALYGFDAIGNESLRNGLYECWQSDILLGKGDPDITAYYRRWKANARCVDLNRNFDCGWETTIGTMQPSCSRYKGESAASEAETKALVALKDAINCVGQIAYHSEGEIVYWDYGSVGDLHVTDEQLADLVCGLTGYTKESTVSSNQETAGCSDYFILECSIPSITIETGVGECPIYIDQWDAIWNQNSQVIPAIAQFFAQA